MACKGARHAKEMANLAKAETAVLEKTATRAIVKTERLLFGVNSKTPATDILQNNITEFEWVVRNKAYPNFWGRNVNGENALTREEIKFIHSKGCKVAAIYSETGEKFTEEQGKKTAKFALEKALELGMPAGAAMFLEIAEGEYASRDYLKGFAKVMIENGLTPAFKANTDAKFDFDREFSRGLQTDPEVFKKCLVWALAPSLAEYDRVTTTHLIHPDNWKPFAPSGITRNDIAVWQYGKNCHPIFDDDGKETAFNVDLVINDRIIVEKMF